MCYKWTYALQDGKIIDYPVPYGRSCKDGSNPAEETILGGNAVVLKQSLGTDPSRRLRRRYGEAPVESRWLFPIRSVDCSPVREFVMTNIEDDRTEGRDPLLWAVGIVVRAAILYPVCLS
jgi:hypothetical protein